MRKKIAIILGSKSDYSYIEEAIKVLDDFDIGYEVKILSAHRNPDALHRYVKKIDREGFKVVIAVAGGAAALPGVVASYTTLPVIGVPVYTKAFKGIDSLLSILQMPRGVPVATMAIGSQGAINAVLLSLRILSINNYYIRKKLLKYKKKIKMLGKK